MAPIKPFAATLALAAGIALAAPAAAQDNYSPREMRAEIADLDREVRYLGRGSRLTNSEYRSLNNRVAKLDELYHRYGRDGFTYRELYALSDRIDAVRAIMRSEARDGDRLRRR